MPPKRVVYFAHEIAEKLGMRTDNLYRKGVLEDLYRQGFPQSLTSGRLRFPMTEVDAWLAPRLRRQAPANDVEAPLAPSNSAEWQAFLHASYSRSR